MKLSIIIPTLNEEVSLVETLQSISGRGHEIIVVDGGSEDRTRLIARKFTPVVIQSHRGRGRQQHEGACRAQGDALIFLHADTRLPKRFEGWVRDALRDPLVAFGAFHLGHEPSSAFLKLISLMANLRSRLLKMPYGDQALFMRRSLYFRAGGFRDLPIMEDVDLVQRLNRMGQFKLVRGTVRTSARRYDGEGLLYTTLRNWAIIIRYLFGQSPERLQRFYSDAR